MYNCLTVKGEDTLKGSIRVGGAKNLVLPVLMASLLADGKNTVTNVPSTLLDVKYTINLLRSLGICVQDDGVKLELEVVGDLTPKASYSDIKALRASFCVLGPLVARCGRAEIALPGGDAFGPRPVDIHINALEKMGADIDVKSGKVLARVNGRLKGEHITFRYPSVGATENIVMAATLAKGTTIIDNAAKEPEIVELVRYLRTMGANIEGEGTSTIIVEGKESLKGGHIEITGDRVEAVTYLCLGAATKGDIKVGGVHPAYVRTFIDILEEMGATVETGEDWVRVQVDEPLRGVNVETGPYPHFSTDYQPLILPLLLTCKGKSTIIENVFPSRLKHIDELNRMGATISVDLKKARISINGECALSGAIVEGHDIRAAMSLVIAGLIAKGTTTVIGLEHIQRGYEDIVSKLSSLGASIRLANYLDDMDCWSGC